MSKVRAGCSICSHPEIRAINVRLRKGTGYLKIEKEFPGASKSALSRHAIFCLSMAAEREVKAINAQVDVYDETIEQLKFAKSLREAAHEFLSHPRDPLAMTLAPRADEVEVVFYDIEIVTDVNGERYVKRTKQMATLEDLLTRAQAQNPGIKIASHQFKRTDVRRYALDAIATVDVVLDKLAKIEGLYTKERDNANTVERALNAYRLYEEKNPDATIEQKREAISLFARGVSVSESILADRAGVSLEIPTVQ